MSLPMALLPALCPNIQTLGILNNRPWVCSYSGGKDSTTLVTWIEMLRRIGLVTAPTPRLVLADTGIEYPFLGVIAADLMTLLRGRGWQCEVVKPPIQHRLYVRIFGIGTTPVHPGNKKMRWCTRGMKIDPMLRWAKSLDADNIMLSGVRYGESRSRDEKLRKPQGCAAGGECGLPEPREDVFGPIINWPTCRVLEWMRGKFSIQTDVIADILPLMARLYEVYEPREEQQATMFGMPPKITAMRFGCVGCPALSGNDKVVKSRAGQTHQAWSHLLQIYSVWDQCYAFANRCVRVKEDGAARAGPLRMEARQRLYAEILSIQEASGMLLVTDEEDAFIRQCWAEKRYPRGWSEADEAVEETGWLFAGTSG